MFDNGDRQLKCFIFGCVSDWAQFIDGSRPQAIQDQDQCLDISISDLRIAMLVILLAQLA